MVSWSRSRFSLLRILFTGIKIFANLEFFTQVNNKGENVSWKATGYSGPDPSFKKAVQETKTIEQMESHESTEQNEDDSHKEHFFGPLYRGIIDPKMPQQIIFEKLQRLGFNVTSAYSKNKRMKPQSPSFIIKCDAVVIGSGSGGGVVAGVLAKAGYKVLVLEKGSYNARNNLSLLEGPTLDEMYLGNGLIATKDLDVVILAGSTVGGGSAINWSASIRTPKHVTKDWSELHKLKLFDSEVYKEALDVVCQKMGVQADVGNEGFNNMVLRKGCQKLGYPVDNIPRNAPADHYCGWCCFGCKDGQKKGTSETWLVDLVNSGNGAIFPDSEAIEVIQEKSKTKRRKAIGVAFTFQSSSGFKELCIVESEVTIVSSGALRTPDLLKKSGLKNPNIGRNLHLHPVVMAWGYFPNEPSSCAWPESSKKSYEGGIMTAMSPVVANFDKSGYGAIIQTPSLHPGLFSILMPWTSGIDFKTKMCKFSRTAHLIALARDKGSGHLITNDTITYNMDKSDEENLMIATEKALRILAAAGAEEIGTHQKTGNTLRVKEASLEEFERFVKEESSRTLKNLSSMICSAHQMGSCRMGIEPKGSAVNPQGETWEVEGLYVADSSVFPTALGVNPMVTVMAVSYCIAQSVLGVLAEKKGKNSNSLPQ